MRIEKLSEDVIKLVEESFKFLTTEQLPTSDLKKNIKINYKYNESIEHGKYPIDIKKELPVIIVHEFSNKICKSIVDEIFKSKSIYYNLKDISILKIRENKINNIVNNKIPVSKFKISSYIMTEIMKYIKLLDANCIIINSYIAAMLTDFSGMNLVCDNKIRNSSRPYIIGDIYGCSIYIDPYMAFNDFRISIGRINCKLTYSDIIYEKSSQDNINNIIINYDIDFNNSIINVIKLDVVNLGDFIISDF